MIETAESRAEFEKRRAKAIAAFKSTIRGELPLEIARSIDPDVTLPGPATTDLTVKQDNKLRKRAEYMREYRKRPKFCPHCKKQI